MVAMTGDETNKCIILHQVFLQYLLPALPGPRSELVTMPARSLTKRKLLLNGLIKMVTLQVTEQIIFLQEEDTIATILNNEKFCI